MKCDVMRKYKKMIYWILPIAWMGVIFMLSNQTGNQSGSLSMSVAEKIFSLIPDASRDIIEWKMWHGFIRKNAHFFVYFVLAVLWIKPLMMTSIKRPYVMALIVSSIYAMTDEFHQLFVDGRVGSIIDVGIDTAGALTGIVLYACVIKGMALRGRVKRHNR